MRLHKIEIQNFRLLAKVELLLEQQATVIVGRNNSGKTSLTELFRRLLSDTSPSFRMEDFSLSAHDDFWKAFRAQEEAKPDNEIRSLLPSIEARLTIKYEKDTPNLGILGECIIDLDPNCEQAVVQIRYELKEGAVSAFFADLPKIAPDKPEPNQKTAFCRMLRERVPKYYSCSVQAVDPNDPTNTKTLDWATLHGVIAGGFINAQRGLDDVTNRERDVLGKVLEALLKNAMSDSADEKDRAVAKELESAVEGMQSGIDTGFNEQLQALLPAFSLFGYPGLADPGLRTETTLDVERMLTNHTKVHYAGVNGINLPEAYNGLGARNLIFILLKLLEFYKGFLAQKTAPGIHLVFIEEPEVHLHPQMQEVFISQLSRIAAEFTKTIGKGLKWPVQFVVTTHSSHLANKADFKAMRYFLVKAAQLLGVTHWYLNKVLRGHMSSKSLTARYQSLVAAENESPPPSYTAAQFAAALGQSKQAVLYKLRGSNPDSARIVSGNAADAWTFSALPIRLQNELAAEAGRLGYPNAEQFLSVPRATWKPARPLNQIAQEDLDKAARLMRALSPSLARLDNLTLSKGELEQYGVADYRREFGFAISTRHWRRLFSRTLERDGGAEQFNRLELYIDERPARPDPGAKASIHADLQNDIALFKNPAEPTLEEKTYFWTRVFEHFETLTERKKNQAGKIRRSLLEFLFARAQFLSKSREALRKQFVRKFAEWTTGGRVPSAIRDERPTKSGRFRAPSLSEDDRGLLTAAAAKLGGGFPMGFNAVCSIFPQPEP